MKTDRRSFLRLFGASSALVATAEGLEKVHSPTAPAEFQQQRVSLPTDFYDVRPWSLYHRIDIPKNEMRMCYTGFAAYRGSDPDLTITNMQMANKLPMPNMFELRKLGIVFSPKTQPALRSAFVDRYEMRFSINQKSYWSGPLSFIFSDTGEPDQDRGFSTLPDIGLGDISEIPLIIADGCQFSAEIMGTPIYPCGKLTFWIVAQGLMARAIQ